MEKAKAMDCIRSRIDIDLIREYLKNNYNFGDMYALLFTFGCNFGLRASDLRLLTFGDLQGTHIELIEKKTRKYRRIFINDKARCEFNNYIKGHVYNNSIREFVYVNDNACIFTGRKYNELDEKSIYRIIRCACEGIGLDGNYGSHTMRKTFAYHCYKLTPDINVLRRLLLHSDAFVTRKYVDSENLKNEVVLNLYDEMSDDEVYSNLNLQIAN